MPLSQHDRISQLEAQLNQVKNVAAILPSHNIGHEYDHLGNINYRNTGSNTAQERIVNTGQEMTDQFNSDNQKTASA
jgi:hypothetical protein